MPLRYPVTPEALNRARLGLVTRHTADVFNTAFDRLRGYTVGDVLDWDTPRKAIGEVLADWEAISSYVSGNHCVFTMERDGAWLLFQPNCEELIRKPLNADTRCAEALDENWAEATLGQRTGWLFSDMSLGWSLAGVDVRDLLVNAVTLFQTIPPAEDEVSAAVLVEAAAVNVFMGLASGTKDDTYMAVVAEVGQAFSEMRAHPTVNRIVAEMTGSRAVRDRRRP